LVSTSDRGIYAPHWWERRYTITTNRNESDQLASYPDWATAHSRKHILDSYDGNGVEVITLYRIIVAHERGVHPAVSGVVEPANKVRSAGGDPLSK
jgi:hypothetical protein